MKKIIKLEENTVEVTPSTVSTDTAGNEVEVYDDNSKEIYGQSRIDSETRNAQSRVANFSNAEWIQAQLDLANEQLGELQTIQAAMDGEVNQIMSSGQPVIIRKIR